MSEVKPLSAEEVAQFRGVIERSDTETMLANGSRWLATLDERDREIERLTARLALLEKATRACLDASGSREGGPCKCGACEAARAALSELDAKEGE
jgi:hypothetical protein